MVNVVETVGGVMMNIKIMCITMLCLSAMGCAPQSYNLKPSPVEMEGYAIPSFSAQKVSLVNAQWNPIE
jgi:hypothetical protein